MSILIIGGDARLAVAIKEKFNKQKLDFVETSKKKETLNKKRIYFNYDNAEFFEIPKNIKKAIVIAAISKYSTFEQDENYSNLICTIKIPHIIEKLLNENIYTCFISSNAVFSGTKFIPTEYDTHCPTFHYGVYKSKTEKSIINISKKINKSKYLSILRLTKNVSIDSSPFNEWIENINQNKRINVFKDIYMSPVLFENSANVIIKLLKTKKNGVFHLSGKKDISYLDFIDGFFEFANINKKLINLTTPEKISRKINYTNHITSLDMKITQNLLKIKPIDLSDIYIYLKKLIKY